MLLSRPGHSHGLEARLTRVYIFCIARKIVDPRPQCTSHSTSDDVIVVVHHSDPCGTHGHDCTCGAIEHAQFLISRPTHFLGCKTATLLYHKQLDVTVKSEDGKGKIYLL